MVNPLRYWRAFVADPRHDTMFLGSPLRRPRVGLVITLVLLLLLVCGLLLQLGMFTHLRMGVFLKALALSTLLAAVPVAVLWFLDRRERESPWLFAAAFFWGACIATSFAGPFNATFFHLVDNWLKTHPVVSLVLGPGAAMMLAAPLSAPIAEEVTKGLGLVVLLWLLRAEFDGVRDGIVYGALIGLGFNWIEAAVYVVQDFAHSGQATYGAQLGARYALFGLSAHALFTALFGASLGLAMQTSRRWLQILSPVVGLLLAIAAHMFVNAQPLLAALSDLKIGVMPEHENVSNMGFLEAFARVLSPISRCSGLSS